jgi:hypothetical protein
VVAGEFSAAADRRLLKLFGAGYLERFRPISRRGSFPPREARAVRECCASATTGPLSSSAIRARPRATRRGPRGGATQRRRHPSPVPRVRQNAARRQELREVQALRHLPYLDTTVVASSSARSTAARSSSCIQAPSAAAGRQGWALRPGSAASATSQLRAEWLARARDEPLARSARPSLPGNRPIPTGGRPCPCHRDDEAQGMSASRFDASSCRASRPPAARASPWH